MIKLIAIICLFTLPEYAFSASVFDAVSVSVQEDGTKTYSLTLQILALMTALTFIPAAMITMTSFTRIIIVLAILRQALGTAQTPTTQTLVGLALFLTIFIMSPVLKTAYETAIVPFVNEEIEIDEAFVNASIPFREFMVSQTRADDIEMFYRISGREYSGEIDEIDFTILVPSFITSELKTAFQIGFIIFIPFLIIDLVVASVLMSMGMMMLSPLIISLPFKIMLFVLVDGWSLIMGTLASSFFTG